MILTGKAKEDFEKWYISQNYELDLTTDLSPHTPVVGFDEIDDSMKYGVFVGFFASDQVKIIAEYSLYDRTVTIIDYDHDVEEQLYKFDLTHEFDSDSTLQELERYMCFAIEKANEIHNKRHE